MASDAADALAKTYAGNKNLLSLRSITNGLPQTGLLVAYTHRASVHLRSAAERAAVGLASLMISGSSRRDDQKPDNVIANDHFANLRLWPLADTSGVMGAHPILSRPIR
jgi:hypothetical protein